MAIAGSPERPVQQTLWPAYTRQSMSVMLALSIIRYIEDAHDQPCPLFRQKTNKTYS